MKMSSDMGYFNMKEKILFWLNCSRLFSLPMTIMSWLVVFIFALSDGGNVWFGLLALIGVCLVHLATNLFDDYVDYKALIKKSGSLDNGQKSKCRYITDGTVTLNDTLRVVILYLGFAGAIGLFLMYFTGWQVLIFAAVGALAALTYPKCTYHCLGEFAVLVTYGPALFGGIYFVMTKSFSVEILCLSIATALMTLGLLYTHTLMDYDFDVKENKKTLCLVLKSKEKALHVLFGIYCLAYLTVALLVIFDVADPSIFITYLTIPMALELYYSLKLYNEDKNTLPERHWWNFPMENQAMIKEQGTESFMFRLYQARNLMVYFSLLLCVSKIVETLLW